MKKKLYVCIGLIALGLGAVGAVIPLLPTFPFLLLSTICCMKSSHNISDRYKEKKWYKSNVEPFLKGHGMTRKAKVRVMLLVTIAMTIGFAMMGNAPLGRIILGGVWVGHMLYFLFGVKTNVSECE